MTLSEARQSIESAVTVEQYIFIIVFIVAVGFIWIYIDEKWRSK